MKLVEILARELVEWLEGEAVVQDRSEKAWAVSGDFENLYWEVDEWILGCGVSADLVCLSELATDHPTAIVTREQWQAERRRIDAQRLFLIACDNGSRPTTTQWNGDGLPPVGALIHWDDGIQTDGYAGLIAVEVVGSYQGAVVAVNPARPRDVYIGKRPHYRPIDTRTPRDKWIEAAHAEGCPTNIAALLFDAGLAKLPEDGK